MLNRIYATYSATVIRTVVSLFVSGYSQTLAEVRSRISEDGRDWWSVTHSSYPNFVARIKQQEKVAKALGINPWEVRKIIDSYEFALEVDLTERACC